MSTKESAPSASWLDLRQGHVIDVLRALPERWVSTCVTSPPYWGLRDYGIEASIWGGDPSCVHLFDLSFSTSETNYVDKRRWQHTRNGRDELQPAEKRVGWRRVGVDHGHLCRCGAWRGWLGLEPTPQLYVEHITSVMREVRRVLRDDGIDLALGQQEQVLMGLCAYDAEAIREADSGQDHTRRVVEPIYDVTPDGGPHSGIRTAEGRNGQGRNKRSVWEIPTEPYPEAHFATFPQALVAPCVLAGCPEGGTVLDPFLGSGTTALVANRLGRRVIGIDANPAYIEMARKRCGQITVWEAMA